MNPCLSFSLSLFPFFVVSPHIISSCFFFFPSSLQLLLSVACFTLMYVCCQRFLSYSSKCPFPLWYGTFYGFGSSSYIFIRNHTHVLSPSAWIFISSSPLFRLHFRRPLWITPSISVESSHSLSHLSTLALVLQYG